MKNLKLFTLIAFVTMALASCSNETEKETSSQRQQQTLEQTLTSNNISSEVEQDVPEIEGEATEVIESELELVQEEVEKEDVETSKSTAVKTSNTAPAKATPNKTKESAPTSSSTTPTAKPAPEAKKKKPVKKVEVEKSTPASKPKTKKKKSGKPSHSAFNSLLNKYVSASGSVDYKGIKSQKSKLDDYLKYLGDNPVQNSWSRNEKMAYWINLYNAATIKLILDNYPTSSIQNINGGKPWDKRWIKSGSKTYTLNEIENSILRPQFKDARIHFAVNCAAFSCPRLMNKAFTASNLNSLLEENARWFINNSTFNSISSKKVQISKIFEWYAVDFGNIIDYLNKYSNTKIKSNAKVSYKEYDWKLNGK